MLASWVLAPDFRQLPVLAASAGDSPGILKDTCWLRWAFRCLKETKEQPISEGSPPMYIGQTNLTAAPVVPGFGRTWHHGCTCCLFQRAKGAYGPSSLLFVFKQPDPDFQQFGSNSANAPGMLKPNRLCSVPFESRKSSYKTTLPRGTVRFCHKDHVARSRKALLQDFASTSPSSLGAGEASARPRAPQMRHGTRNPHGCEQCETIECYKYMAMGQNPVPPMNIPIPTKID